MGRGGGGQGRGPRLSGKGPRVSEHRKVVWSSSSKHLSSEVSRPAPSRTLSTGWGSTGQKEDKEDPFTPASVMGPRSPSTMAELKGGHKGGWAQT